MTPLLNRSAPAIPPKQPSAPLPFASAEEMLAAMKADARRINGRRKPPPTVSEGRGSVIGGIVAALECGEALNAEQIFEKCGRSVTSGHSQLKNMERKGHLIIDRSKGRGKFTYKLVNP